jgi:pre-mRNA-processing factor 39
MYRLLEVLLMGVLSFFSWDCKCASFRKLVTLLEQEVTSCAAGRLLDKIHTSEVIEAEDSELDISTIIADLFDQKGGHISPEALKNYLATGERLYKRSSKIDIEICCFEASIKRPFFHVKPLDVDQLENWHQYLDYVEKNGDFDWVFFI